MSANELSQSNIASFLEVFLEVGERSDELAVAEIRDAIEDLNMYVEYGTAQDAKVGAFYNTLEEAKAVESVGNLIYSMLRERKRIEEMLVDTRWREILQETAAAIKLLQS